MRAIRKVRLFFSEEKKQKTFYNVSSEHSVTWKPQAQRHKSLFASFSSEKEVFLSLVLLLAPAKAQAASHTGGTLWLTTTTASGSIDPHINYTERYYQVFAAVTDGLVTFRKSDGATSVDVVPDLADSLPVITDGGTTYSFHLRAGIKFSDGRTVGVEDVAASLRRMFKVVGPNADSWYSIIVGGKDCVKTPATCTLAGGVMTDAATNTIVLHLTHPNAEFLQQLALPIASVLPADTPPHDLGITPPITTGPYRIESYNPQRALVLTRNPYFHEWSRAAQPAGYPDKINYRFGLQTEDEISGVLTGQLDWTPDPIPIDRLPEIGARYANLVHISQTQGYFFLSMNVNLAPFNQIALRRAVALAVNRRALINLFGGPALATPLCQLLPNGVPGYVPFCPFSNPAGAPWQAPDLATARAALRGTSALGTAVTIITRDGTVERSAGLYLQSLLSDLGFAAHTRAVSNQIFAPYVQNSANQVQMALNSWFPDYPAPSNFLRLMYACTSFHPGADISTNFAGFCNPAIDAQMQTAERLALTDPTAAAALWADIDHRLTDTAAGTGLFQISLLDLSSPRLGNYQFSAVYHRLLSQTWVQ